ncbi:uncharacterized protein TrAFT101_011654 [Trichoderma asperellum]|uniref:uncharacterized protein n=1 Tax=Trichoderma asperellum TaxID=101201 RepID=UPI0033231C5D|nr:hypothetical protein TrAFT101_011654 [Trichoderma asperellum]
MLPTESLGWIGFQALKVRLAGRLAVLAKREADLDRPTKYQNDVDLLDCDLRDIFKTATLDIDLISEDFKELEERAQDLLISLNDMVNEDIIYSPKTSAHNGSHDITKIRNAYPKLSALMLYLDASDYKQFNLLGDPGPSLFILPRDHIGDQIVSQVLAWKMFLQRVVARSDKSQSWLGIGVSQSPMYAGPVKLAEQKLSMVQNPVGVVMDAILKEFQQTNCGITHELKLRVLEELYTSPYHPRLEMLLSCCQSERDWQEAICDSFRNPVNLKKKNDICVAIHKTWKQRTKLRLFVDQRGLFDVTDEGPPISTSLHDHEEEGLNLLLDKNAFRPISPGAYLSGMAIQRFDHREKTALALSLARCLLVFFDKSLERAFCNWSAENIFFMHTSRPYGELPRWHLLVGSQPPSVNYPNFLHKIVPGNPVLLSFAKLLLEIINGERIPLEIDLQNISKNIGNWAQMCSYVEEARQDGNSFYLQAVQGCLYLHMHLQKGDDLKSINSSGAAMREVIYEQIVRNLEKELNPEGLKRKRRESFSERPHSKRLHSDELLEVADRKLEGLSERCTKSALAILPSQRGMVPSRATRDTGVNGFFGHDGAERPSQNSLRSMTTAINAASTAPPRREYFNVAVICAIVTEYNAVCQIFDEFWDEEGDQYGRAQGDLNTYTTGRIGKHNVVLALLPHIGKSNAAAAAASFRSSYTHVELALLVGVCGGVPRVGGYEEDEILLGDVVISRAVVQYDFGRKYAENFIRKNTFEDNLGKATKNIQSLLKNFETDRGLSLLQSQTAQFLIQLQNKRSGNNKRLLNKYRYPGTAKDRLFRSDYRHMHRDFHGHCCSICGSGSGVVCEEALNATCEDLGCEGNYVVERARLQEKHELELNSSEEAQAPAIHLGAVASGDTVLKSGRDRDEIAQKEGVIAFEMEAAGIWGEIPCIIVKGVCDYADSHKNKQWQDYAAATAAAAAKALLYRYPRTEKSQTWVD